MSCPRVFSSGTNHYYQMKSKHSPAKPLLSYRLCLMLFEETAKQFLLLQSIEEPLYEYKIWMLCCVLGI